METIKGLQVTFLHDTCSSLCPYEPIPAGITLQVQGIMFDSPESGPDQVMVHLALDDEDPSIDLGVTLSELLEVTNISDLVEFQQRLASAERSVTHSRVM